MAKKCTERNLSNALAFFLGIPDFCKPLNTKLWTIIISDYLQPINWKTVAVAAVLYMSATVYFTKAWPHVKDMPKTKGATLLQQSST